MVSSLVGIIATNADLESHLQLSMNSTRLACTKSVVGRSLVGKTATNEDLESHLQLSMNSTRSVSAKSAVVSNLYQTKKTR